MALIVPDYGWSASFAGVEAHTHAWSTLNLTEFRAVSMRSENTVMGGRGGRRGNRSHRDEIRVVIETLFVGDCAWDDPADVADPADQLEATLAYWVANVIDATEDARGCVAGTFRDASGNNYTADVQIRGWIPPTGLFEGVGMTTIVVPDGRLTLVVP